MTNRPFTLIPTITSDSLFTDRFNRLDDIFSRLSGEKSIHRLPDYNIKQLDDTHYGITLSVPGFTEKDLNIRHGDGQLIIEGKHEEKEDANADKDDKWLHKGIQKRSFSLSFGLDNAMEISEANLKEGLLNIVIEQRKKDENFKEIAIGVK